MPRFFEDHWQDMQRRRCCTCHMMLVPLARAARWSSIAAAFRVIVTMLHLLRARVCDAHLHFLLTRTCYFCSDVRIGGIPKGRHASSGFSSGPGIAEFGYSRRQGSVSYTTFAAVCVPGKHTFVGMSVACIYGWIHVISRMPDLCSCKCFACLAVCMYLDIK